MPRGLPAGALLCMLVLLTACDESEPKAEAPPPAPKVEVAEATEAKVPLTREFVGTTAAVQYVEIRSRVKGYLEKRPFDEGSDVKKGDVLFVIDQRPFEAEVEQSKAELAQNQAQLAFAQEQRKRYETLLKDSVASVQKFQEVKNDELEAAGAVSASKAALKDAELDLEFTTITAPIDGRISNTQVHVGNLVSAEETLLTTLVQLDPIYVYFNPSEAMYQEIAPYQAKGPLKATMIMASGAVYPHAGTVDFVDNQVDAGTGTIKMRAVFPNADKAQRPGQFVRVRVTLTDDRDAILVPVASITEDEGGHHLYVVDKDDKAERRNVKLGPIHKDDYIIDEGVKAGERVVVTGLQKVHGGKPVEVMTAAKPKAATADSKPKSE